MGIFEKVIDGLLDLFPSSEEITISNETQLDDIPEWDSMASVNLMMFLKQNFNIDIPDGFLHGELKIGELVNHIGG